MRVCLMAHIPHHPVLIQIKGLIKSKSQLNNTQSGPKMPATVGNNLEMALPDLFSNVLELCHGEAMQLIGMG